MLTLYLEVLKMTKVGKKKMKCNDWKKSDGAQLCPTLSAPMDYNTKTSVTELFDKNTGVSCHFFSGSSPTMIEPGSPALPSRFFAI